MLVEEPIKQMVVEAALIFSVILERM
ncbi:hypothetical protein NOCA1130310 [metagenome]|uniref:Uncharacterized protein n=1 Tax=metagenome TaxID=256318 RepID=A0A2P2C7J0_9ZZZZ